MLFCELFINLYNSGQNLDRSHTRCKDFLALRKQVYSLMAKVTELEKLGKMGEIGDKSH